MSDWDRVNERFALAPPAPKMPEPEKVPPRPSAAELQALSDRPGNRWYGRRPGGNGNA